MDTLKLEIPTLARKDDALDFLSEFVTAGEHPHGTNHLYYLAENDRPLKTYEDWLSACMAGYKVPLVVGTDKAPLARADKIPHRTGFLVRESDNRIVGMTDIRFKLDDHYWNFGGNIGYSIRPSERRKGYGKANLYLTLQACEYGDLEAVLLDCRNDNVASRRIIRALGGKLLRRFSMNDIQYCTFAICVRHSLETYYDLYKDHNLHATLFRAFDDSI